MRLTPGKGRGKPEAEGFPLWWQRRFFFNLQAMSYESFKGYWSIMLADETSSAVAEVSGTPLCPAMRRAI
jgi:hypothetical protein